MFALHYLLPFIVLSVLVAHLVALHHHGSGGCSALPAADHDTDTFYLYVLKDMLVVLSVVGSAMVCSIIYPDTLHHPDNYVYVSRYNTPRHIVPE